MKVRFDIAWSQNLILNAIYLKQLNHVYLGSFLKGSFSVKSVCIVRRQLWHFRIFGQLSLGTLRFYTFRKLGILKLKYLSRKVFGYFVNLICSLDPTSNSKLYFTKCFNQSKWLFFVYLLFYLVETIRFFKS